MTKRYNKIEIAGIINRQVHSLKLFQYFSNRRNFAQVWETDMKSGSIAGKIKPHSKKWKMAFYIISTAAFLAAVTYLGIKFGPKITQLARNPEELREWLNSFGWKGIIIFIGLQVLQVVVAAIPGEFTQLAGAIYTEHFSALYTHWRALYWGQ